MACLLGFLRIFEIKKSRLTPLLELLWTNLGPILIVFWMILSSVWDEVFGFLPIFDDPSFNYRLIEVKSSYFGAKDWSIEVKTKTLGAKRLMNRGENFEL